MMNNENYIVDGWKFETKEPVDRLLTCHQFLVL